MRTGIRPLPHRQKGIHQGGISLEADGSRRCGEQAQRQSESHHLVQMMLWILSAWSIFFLMAICHRNA